MTDITPPNVPGSPAAPVSPVTVTSVAPPMGTAPVAPAPAAANPAATAPISPPPSVTPVAPATPSPSAPNPAPTSAPAQAGVKRILLVEDEPDLLALYTRLLKSQNYNVETADNGATALEKMQAGGFDLVLLDIMLPKMDGLQVLDEIKKKPPAQPIGAVVLLTNLNQDDVIAKSVQYGVRGYLVKSDYTPDKFLSEVKSILQ